MRLRLLPLLGLAGLLACGSPVWGDDVPADAGKLVKDYERDVEEIRKNTEQFIKLRKEKLLKTLQGLQEAYAKDGKQAEARAVAALIRDLNTDKPAVAAPPNDPRPELPAGVDKV